MNLSPATVFIGLVYRESKVLSCWDKKIQEGKYLALGALEKLPELVKQFGDATRLSTIKLHGGKSFAGPCAAGLRPKLASFLFEHLLEEE